MFCTKTASNPNPMAGDVSRVSLHVWESFMEKTGNGDPVGNNIHRENEADGSVLRRGTGISHDASMGLVYLPT